MLKLVDKKLTELATSLKQITFDDPSGYYAEEVQAIRKNIDLAPRNTYLLPNQRTWVVKASIRSRGFNVGYTDDPTVAFRFADMACLYFWGYRARGADIPEPTVMHLNFSLALAKSNLELHTEAKQLLISIESRLREIYDFPERGAPRKKRSDAGVKRGMNANTQGLTNTIMSCTGEIQSYIDDSVGPLDRKLDRIETKLDTIARSLFSPLVVVEESGQPRTTLEQKLDALIERMRHMPYVYSTAPAAACLESNEKLPSPSPQIICEGQTIEQFNKSLTDAIHINQNT